MRDAVYHELPPAERELEHERAAEMLREAGADIEQVAAQLLLAPRRGAAWAAELLQRAGERRRAPRRGGERGRLPAPARSRSRRAPEQRTRVLIDLGIAEALTTGPAAAEHLQEAYDLLEDPRARGELANVLGRVLLFTGDPVRAERIAKEAEAALGPDDADLARTLEAFSLIAFYFGGGDDRALERVVRYRSVPELPGAGARMLSGIASYDWMNRGGNADDCAALSLAALDGGGCSRRRTPRCWPSARSSR